MARVATVQRDISSCHGKRVFDQGSRESNAPVRTERGASRCHVSDAGLGCVRQADFFQGVECSRVDALFISRSQRAVRAA